MGKKAAKLTSITNDDIFKQIRIRHVLQSETTPEKKSKLKYDATARTKKHRKMSNNCQQINKTKQYKKQYKTRDK